MAKHCRLHRLETGKCLAASCHLIEAQCPSHVGKSINEVANRALKLAVGREKRVGEVWKRWPPGQHNAKKDSRLTTEHRLGAVRGHQLTECDIHS